MLPCWKSLEAVDLIVDASSIAVPTSSGASSGTPPLWFLLPFFSLWHSAFNSLLETHKKFNIHFIFQFFDTHGRHFLLFFQQTNLHSSKESPRPKKGEGSEHDKHLAQMKPNLEGDSRYILEQE
jgi:hypothetical protein